MDCGKVLLVTDKMIFKKKNLLQEDNKIIITAIKDWVQATDVTD